MTNHTFVFDGNYDVIMRIGQELGIRSRFNMIQAAYENQMISALDFSRFKNALQLRNAMAHVGISKQRRGE